MPTDPKPWRLYLVTIPEWCDASVVVAPSGAAARVNLANAMHEYDGIRFGDAIRKIRVKAQGPADGLEAFRSAREVERGAVLAAVLLQERRKAREAVDAWNLANASPVAVRYWSGVRGDGHDRVSTTKGQAFVTEAWNAVVYVVGCGTVSLTHVDVLR